MFLLEFEVDRKVQSVSIYFVGSALCGVIILFKSEHLRNDKAQRVEILPTLNNFSAGMRHHVFSVMYWSLQACPWYLCKVVFLRRFHTIVEYSSDD